MTVSGLGICNRHFIATLMAAAAVAFAPSSAIAAGSVDFKVVVNGVPTVDTPTPFPAGASRSFINRGAVPGATWNLSGGGATSLAIISMALSGASNTTAQVKVLTDSGPAFLRTVGGGPRPDISAGKLVLYQSAAASVLGNGHVNVKLSVDFQVVSTGAAASGEGERPLADQPGRDSVEFPVTVNLPTNIPLAGSITVVMRTQFAADASISPSTQQAVIDATSPGAKIQGFRVFNSAGLQLTGFTLGPLVELPPISAGKTLAVEYYNAQFGHYFISTSPQEIANLDSGSPPGWARTGESFLVYTSEAAGRAAVCRFFSGQAFAPKSSHFYAPRGLGCEVLLPSNAVWAFEGDVFYSALPDLNGLCPDGNVPVYRLYNNGQGGAPNHRFTTRVEVQLDMIANGYVAEGNGPGVGMCSPL